MKLYRIIFAILIALLSYQTTSAQVNDQDEIIKHRVAEKVAQINDYISFMASKKRSLENRKYYKTKALNLFIGRGYSYEYNGVESEGVMVEITYPSRHTKKKMLVSNFFDQVIGLRYTDVRIISAEVGMVYYEETADGQEPCVLLGNITAEIKDY